MTPWKTCSNISNALFYLTRIATHRHAYCNEFISKCFISFSDDTCAWGTLFVIYRGSAVRRFHGPNLARFVEKSPVDGSSPWLTSLMQSVKCHKNLQYCLIHVFKVAKFDDSGDMRLYYTITVQHLWLTSMIQVITASANLPSYAKYAVCIVPCHVQPCWPCFNPLLSTNWTFVALWWPVHLTSCCSDSS